MVYNKDFIIWNDEKENNDLKPEAKISNNETSEVETRTLLILDKMITGKASDIQISEKITNPCTLYNIHTTLKHC